MGSHFAPMILMRIMRPTHSSWKFNLRYWLIGLRQLPGLLIAYANSVGEWRTEILEMSRTTAGGVAPSQNGGEVQPHVVQSLDWRARQAAARVPRPLPA